VVSSPGEASRTSAALPLVSPGGVPATEATGVSPIVELGESAKRLPKAYRAVPRDDGGEDVAGSDRSGVIGVRGTAPDACVGRSMVDVDAIKVPDSDAEGKVVDAETDPIPRKGGGDDNGGALDQSSGSGSCIDCGGGDQSCDGSNTSFARCVTLSAT